MTGECKRRDFLRRAGWLVLALGTLNFGAGCGGGGGGGGSAAASVATISVDPTFVSAAPLTIGSYLGASAVSSLKASAAVATDQAVLLFCTDASGKVEALLAYAATDGAPATMSASTTALALVFLTLGIATSDQGTATARLAAIGSLSSFPPLANYIASHGSAGNIFGLSTDPTYQGLIAQCIGDYFAATPTNWSISPSFDAALRGSTESVFENFAPRWVSVVQEELAAGTGASLGGADSPLAISLTGNGSISAASGLLPGPALLAAGGLSTLLGPPVSDFAPIVYDSNLQVGTLRYWAFGPGIGGNAPAGVVASASVNEAWFYSVYTYLVAPLADLVLGTAVQSQIAGSTPSIWISHQAAFSAATVIANPSQAGILSLMQEVAGFVDGWVKQNGMPAPILQANAILAWYESFLGTWNLGAVAACWLALGGQANSDVSLASLKVGIS